MGKYKYLGLGKETKIQELHGFCKVEEPQAKIDKLVVPQITKMKS